MQANATDTDELRERVEALEAENKRKDDEIERLSRDLASERARSTNLEETVEQQAERIDELEAGTAQTDESNDSGDERAAWTPMAYILNNESDAVVNDLTPSDRRAKAIAENFAQWSTKAPNGMVIRDGLKELLSTATGERLEWSQVNRACEHLADLTKGAIALRRTSKHGNVVIAQTDDHRLRPLLASGG